MKRLGISILVVALVIPLLASTLFPTGPLSIATVSFFDIYSPGSITGATYDVHFSTTSKAVSGLDTSTLSNNVGGNDAQFFSGVLSGTITGTKFTITGTTPFTYDPSGGNLLLDITKSESFGSSGTVYLDAHNGTFGTSSSRAHTFGTGFSSWGLVTEFETTTTVIPEPGTLALFGVGGPTVTPRG